MGFSWLRISLLVVFVLGTPGTTVHGQIGSSADSDFLYAQKLYDDGMYQLSAQLFGSFFKNYPNDSRVPDARFYTGMSFYKLDEFESARQEFQYLAIEFPDHLRAPQAWEKVGDAYSQLGNTFEAANAYARVEEYFPGNLKAVPSLLKAVDYYLKAGKVINAKEKLAKLIRERPNIPEVNHARLKQAIISRMEGGFNTAIIDLTKVMDASKDVELASTALFERARTLEMLGKIDDTRRDYVTLIEKFAGTSSSYHAQFQLGILYVRENDFNQAEQSFQTVVAGTKDLFLKQRAYLELGDIRFLRKEFSEAQVIYESITGVHGDIAGQDSSFEVEVIFKLGLTLENQDDLKSANERFETLIACHRNSAEALPFLAAAHIKLSRNYEKLGSPKDALFYIDQFLKLFPGHRLTDRVLFDRGRILEESLGNHEEAVYTYKQLLKDYPRSPLVDKTYFVLGRTYLNNGQTSLAKDAFSVLVTDFSGSDLLEAASQKLLFMDRYLSLKNDETMERLILLIGNLIDEKSKDRLSFEYGMLFFEQLKKYEAAAPLFEKVLSSSTDQALIQDAQYHLAYSYKRLAERTPGKIDTAFAAAASKVFQQMTKGPWADEAAIQIVELRLAQIFDTKQRAIKARSFYQGLIERYPNAAMKDFMLYQLGNAFYDLGDFAAKPEPVPNKKSEEKKPQQSAPQSAIACYAALINEFPKSSLIQESRFKKAFAHFNSGQLDKAAISLEESIKAFPKSPYIARSSLLLARLKEAKADYKAATGLYNDLISRFYYSSYVDSAVTGIGDAYMITGRYEEAIKAFRTAQALKASEFADIDVLNISRSEHDPADFKTAVCYEKLGNLSRSKEFFQKYLSPNNEGAFAAASLYAIAEIEIKRKNEQNAIDFYQKVLTGFEKTDLGFEAANKLAQLRVKRKEYQEAMKVYETLVSLGRNTDQKMYYDSRIIISLYQIDQIQLALQKEDAFEARYKKLDVKADKIANYQGEFIYELGKYYQYSKKNFAFARQQYNKVLSKYKKSSVIDRVEYELGVITIDEGKELKKGIEMLMEIPKRYPYSEILADVYLKLAVTFFNDLEDMESAIASCRAALKEESLNTDSRKRAMNLLIKIYKASGLHEETLLALKDYLKTFPDTGEDDILAKKIDIGAQYKNLKEYDRAIQYFKDLIVLASGEDEAEIQFNIGETYFQQGKYDLAVIEYLKIAYLTFNTKLDWATPAKSQAAESYKRLGKYDQAISLYKEIINKHGATSQYGKFSKAKIEELEKLKF